MGETNDNVRVLRDSKNKEIVVIRDIRFAGKRQINWKDVFIRYCEYKKRNEHPALALAVRLQTHFF